jgi:hypothetical protein
VWGTDEICLLSDIRAGTGYHNRLLLKRAHRKQRFCEALTCCSPPFHPDSGPNRAAVWRNQADAPIRPSLEPTCGLVLGNAALSGNPVLGQFELTHTGNPLERTVGISDRWSQKLSPDVLINNPGFLTGCHVEPSPVASDAGSERFRTRNDASLAIASFIILYLNGQPKR